MKTKVAVRSDEIGFGGYTLLQEPDSFCYGVDAVLLADFCAAVPEDTVLDICCGNGAVALIAYAKYHPESVSGLELQKEQAQLAEKSMELNGLSDKIRIVCGDAAEIERYFAKGSFSLVVCNPPYFESGRGPSCEDSPRHIARHESSTGLGGFFRAAAYVLKSGGRLAMVHRPERLADLMDLSRACGLEPKKVQMVAPHADEAPNLVLVQFVKGGGKGIVMLPQLPVRERNGGFTKEIDKIYGRPHKQNNA